MKRETLWKLGVGLVVLLIAAIILRNLAIGWAPSREQYPIQGITVSQANGEIVWHVVGATNVDFAYLQATAGADVRDERFEINLAGAREAGIRHGPLHEYSLCKLASDQARNFITTVPREANFLPPAIRLSFDGCADRPGRALVISELNTFLNQIEAHSGKKAVLAISRDFEELYTVSAALPRTVWLESNFFPPDYAVKPWVMWRASDMRRISGLSGPVHWNVVQP
jgi:lysozyme